MGLLLYFQLILHLKKGIHDSQQYVLKLYLEDLGIDHSSLLNFLHFFCRKKSPSHFYRETTVKINYSLLIYSWIRHSFRGYSFESKMPCCGF